MSPVLEITAAEGLSDLPGVAGIEPLGPAAFESHRPDVHLALMDDHGMLAARVSLWTSHAPALADHVVGVIGHYAAGSRESGAALLDAACARLSSRGCTLAVGPMDGDTSGRYRFIIERGDEPPFFLEPDNPDDWPGHFEAAGFDVHATYRSSLDTDLWRIDARVDGLRSQLTERGIAIRPLRMDRFDAELRTIFELSNGAFSRAFLHTPLRWPSFAAMYEPMRSRIDPRLVLIAECDGLPVGFIFAVPDLNQAMRGRAIDTVIIKTVAVLPDRRYAGLGGLLISDCQQAARQLGFSRAIHALMHEGNSAIMNLSSRYARPMRRYALFARKLRP